MKVILAICIVIVAALLVSALPVQAQTCPSCSAPTPVFDPLPTLPPYCMKVEGVIRCKVTDNRTGNPPPSAQVPTPFFDFPLWPVVIYDNTSTRAGGNQISIVR